MRTLVGLTLWQCCYSTHLEEAGPCDGTPVAVHGAGAGSAASPQTGGGAQAKAVEGAAAAPVRQIVTALVARQRVIGQLVVFITCLRSQ